MGDHRTVEDVVLTALQQHGTDQLYPDDEFDCCAKEVHTFLVDATADGPVFSADGSLAVIRTDPELAVGLPCQNLRRSWMADNISTMEPCPEWDEDWTDWCVCCRAAALLAAPAPADPEED